MEKNKLCIIYNSAPHYRKGIFTLIEREYDCIWFFGNQKTDIKSLDLSLLRNAYISKRIKLLGDYYWQKDILRQLFWKKLKTYLVLGDTHCISTWLFIFTKKILCPKKKIYFWTHGWYGKESKSTQLLKKCFYKTVDGVFLYGNYAKQLMIDNGFNANKLFVIHNSLDHNRHLELRQKCQPTDIFHKHFGNHDKNLIFIGRLTTVKRINLLIEALAELKDKGKNYNLTLIGDGEMRNDLQQQVKKLSLDDSVWFYGSCYDEAINAELIYNADLCVAPGNVGLTAMHVMVFGTPVATHDDFKWQMPEFEAIQEGKTGIFFRRNDAHSIAISINRWFNQQKDREEIRQHCFHEIDTSWTPTFQLDVIRKNMKF